jgi:hypothetical protein
MWAHVYYCVELNIWLIIQLLIRLIGSSVLKNWIREPNHIGFFFQFELFWIIGSIRFFLSPYTPTHAHIHNVGFHSLWIFFANIQYVWIHLISLVNICISTILFFDMIIRAVLYYYECYTLTEVFTNCPSTSF